MLSSCWHARCAMDSLRSAGVHKGLSDMRLDASQYMRMDMRMKLAPRMIQSMEILQLPLMALEERIEQELQANPVLELQEGEGEPVEIADQVDAKGEDRSEDERSLVVKEESN